MVMVCAQLVAFGRVSSKRQEMHERKATARRKAATMQNTKKKTVAVPMVAEPPTREDERPIPMSNGDLNMKPNGILHHGKGMNGHVIHSDEDIEWDMGS